MFHCKHKNIDHSSLKKAAFHPDCNKQKEILTHGQPLAKSLENGERCAQYIVIKLFIRVFALLLSMTVIFFFRHSGFLNTDPQKTINVKVKTKYFSCVCPTGYTADLQLNDRI